MRPIGPIGSRQSPVLPRRGNTTNWGVVSQPDRQMMAYAFRTSTPLAEFFASKAVNGVDVVEFMICKAGVSRRWRIKIGFEAQKRLVISGRRDMVASDGWSKGDARA